MNNVSRFLLLAPRSVLATLGVAAMTAGGLVLAPAVAPTNAAAEQAPILSADEWLKKGTVNGYVFVDRVGNRTTKQPDDVPLSNVKVYAQWKDADGVVSPVYTANTKSDGSYSIALPDWKDANGRSHKFKSHIGQQLRTWFDNPDPSKYWKSFSEADGNFGSVGDRYQSTWLDLSHVYNQNMTVQEIPQTDQMHKARADWKKSTRKGGGGDVTGAVFYDMRGAFGNTAAPTASEKIYGDVGVPGTTVVGSYVQDEVARRFDQWKKAHKGFSFDEFTAAQREIIKKYEAETGKSAIAETVYDVTDNEGRYHLQFDGLGGTSYRDKGISTLAWGEPVPANKGSWAAGNMQSKHVNTGYMYVSPVLPEGLGAAMNNFQSNRYQFGGEEVGYATAPGLSNVENVRFALKMQDLVFDVTDYNTTDKPATPGTTVNTKTAGTFPNTDYDIVWTDDKGKEVGSCTATSSNLGVLEPCAFVVPKDLDQPTTYTAQLYPKGIRKTALAADSFTAKVTPEYKQTSVEPGKSTTVDTPLHSENGTKPAKGTKFAPANIDKDEIPEGAVKEIPKWATVNGDGTIAVSPDAGVPEGDYNIPVKVTYPNGVEKVVLAPIHVGKKQITDSVDPKYAQDTVVKAGESGTVVAPKDADGNALPEGTKFVPGKDVPEWAKVNPDGSITVAPGKDVVPGDYKVPVVVTYPDGSTDAVEVPVKVTEGGKGRTDAGKPAWDDASTPADKTVVIPNKGGDVVEGTTVEVEGPGKAEIGADGSLKVTPSADAKPGDKIVAKVKDGEGNVIDTVTVTLTDPEADKPVTDSVDPKYAQDTVVKAGESGTVVAPKDADGNALPEGTKFVPGKDVPEWAKVNPDGSITVAPGKDVVPGDYKVPVVVTYPDGSTDAVEVPVKVTEGGKGRTDAGKPAWDDASTPADKTVVIPNKGGDVVEGTTVEVEGPGKAEIGADGSLKVTPSADAKPGDKIVAKVKDGEGNVIDTVTVRISENVRGNSRKVVRTIARTSIAKTGVQVFGYGAASAALLLAGVGVIAAARRCKED